jgi:crossover junction endodeoxyribonuclease RusA
MMRRDVHPLDVDEDEAFELRRARRDADLEERTLYRLVLPYPISANDYWRHIAHPKTRRPVTIVSREAKAYRALVGMHARSVIAKPIAGPVELCFRLFPENRICLDLDNALKVAIDALKGVAFLDDSQVVKINAERCAPDSGKKRLEVAIAGAAWSG